MRIFYYNSPVVLDWFVTLIVVVLLRNLRFSVGNMNPERQFNPNYIQGYGYDGNVYPPINIGVQRILINPYQPVQLSEDGRQEPYYCFVKKCEDSQMRAETSNSYVQPISFAKVSVGDEIRQFYLNNIQTDAMFSEKMKMVKDLSEYLKSFCALRAILLTGSSVTGLGLNDCDMDLCLITPTPRREYYIERHLALQTLQACYNAFCNPNSPICQHQIITAKVPILRGKFVNPWGYSVDINCNHVLGIYNSYLLRSYVKIDDRFAPLVICIKHWAKLKGLCDAQNGYLNSYSWTLLVLNYLQCGVRPPVLPSLQSLYPNHFNANIDVLDINFNTPFPFEFRSENVQPIEQLFAGFFRHYGCRVNYEMEMISVRLGCRVPRENQISPIWIEEPFNFQNTAQSLFLRTRFVRLLREVQLADWQLHHGASFANLCGIHSKTASIPQMHS
ncbi:Poly(A) RNA polymerase GLD2-A [Trichinella spiralis]|uniref:Poly(A) RNA polymerase GLD2-A n=1 Tax=Trichinella spiralis TaxID=6334 RepID=A0A0V1BKP6_TRISP|nr:Poly(A) RNA polymerase GLD2-A [Trichinella spiralis]